MNITTRLSIHDADVDLYNAFKQVFGETEAEGSRWIEFESSEGVIVVFFSPRHGSTDEQEEVTA
jgi:hypothetical protein